MKQLQKSDLKEGEIYKQLDFNYIFLYNKNETYDSFNDGTAISTTDPRYCKRWSANGFEKDMIEATPEEKHWLETCIKADKFVSYEEAMKTFVQYYKIIENRITDNYNNNVIYKHNIVFGHYEGNHRIIKSIEIGKHNNDSTINVLYGEIGELKVCFDIRALQPSTKEAYDAQFVVKEPEFVLPEKWCIKLTEENYKTLGKWRTDGELPMSNLHYNCLNCYLHTPMHNKNGYNEPNKDPKYIEITFDQFKKYVLKENTIVTEKPKVVLEEPKDKVLAHLIQSDITLIHSVECSEGGVYRVGDKIRVFDKYSPNKGKIFTIHRFRWSKDKSKICAVTELHTPNGIGLDKIELYVEPKVKIIDEFVLPEKWYVKDISKNEIDIVCEYGNKMWSTPNYNCKTWKPTMLGKILIGNYSSGRPYFVNNDFLHNHTEITFEQFKKYVLKNE